MVAAAGCNSGDGRGPLAFASAGLSHGGSGGAPATRPVVNEDEIRSDVYFLASDRLEGRGVGTQGLDVAGDFIASRFASLGLKPLPGLDGYFQTFEMITSESIAPETGLTVAGRAFKVKQDFVPASFSGEKVFEGPVVFAGYGITNKEKGYDDYAGLDVKGKVVLILRFEPHDAKGKSRWAKDEYSEHSHLDVKAKNAESHGAAAVIMVNPPKYHYAENEDPLLAFVRQPSSAMPMPFVHVTRAAAGEVLKKAGAPELAELQGRLDRDVKPASFDLKDVTASGRVALARTRRPVRNVVAYLPGTKADEYVVVGSHYDHLGWGGPGSLMAMPTSAHGVAAAATQAGPDLIEGIGRVLTGQADRPATRPATVPAVVVHPGAHAATTNNSVPAMRAIHHGADDNASGTAAMLELARVMARRAAAEGRPPERSVVFCAFTAEESGLNGSARFVKDPPIDLKKTAAMLNFDMVGRVRNNLLYVGGGGTAAPLKGLLEKADEDSPLQFKNFGDGGLGPSDHMSFALKKVPVLFLFSGNHADYHRPSDTADKVNYDGIAEVVRVGAELIDELARMPMSAYVDAADKSSMMNPMTAGTGGEGVRRASLGVVPEYGGEEDGKGVVIGGTTSGTPAEKAGLRGGDVIVKVGERATGTLMELSTALASYKPGDRVKVVYRRGGQERTADVVLGGRGG
jgi:Zn-dependent M28 family amino/carboxypeptidase